MAFRRIWVCAALIYFSPTNSFAQVASDFSADFDGWTSDGASPAYAATGGNPGGLIFSSSPGSVVVGAQVIWFWYYFYAPTKFNGDKSAYYNGNLRYDVQQSSAGTAVNLAEVVITDNSGVSIYYYPPAGFQPPPAPDWTTFNIRLSADEGYWKTTDASTAPAATETQIRTILSNIATLQIQGLFQNANVQTRMDNVTLYPPIAIDTQPDSHFVCEGEVVTFTTAASNNPDITYQWQILDDVNGMWNDLAEGGGYAGVATSSLEVNTTAMFGSGTYRARISGTAVDDGYTFDAILNVAPRPAPPTTAGAESCDPASLTLTAEGGTDGLYRWYDVETGGTPIDGATGEAYVTPDLSVTTNYYVESLLVTGNTVCESARTQVIAHIGSPDPPTATGAKSCTAAALILTANGGGPGQYRWYTQETGGGPDGDQHSKTFLTPTLDSTVTYYVSINNGLCESDRTAVTATIGGGDCQPPAPSAPGIEIFNAVSPNKDGKNDLFFVRNIDAVNETKKNHVTIFNRWGDMVWEGNDYNNTTVAFTGLSKNNAELPSGTYYFKIEFQSGKKPETGYISLKR